MKGTLWLNPTLAKPALFTHGERRPEVLRAVERDPANVSMVVSECCEADSGITALGALKQLKLTGSIIPGGSADAADERGVPGRRRWDSSRK